MSFTNPFTRIKDLENEGYLRVNVRQFLNIESKPASFYQAIDALVTIREGLLVAQSGGMLPQLGDAPTYYRNALLWLNFAQAIDTGISVPAITTYDDINDPIADAFFQYVQWLQNNHLIPNATYQLIQTQLGMQKVDKLKQLELKAEAYNEDFKNILHNAQKNLAESTDNTNRELTSQLDSLFNTQVESIRTNKDEALASIKKAQSLTIWHESYIKNIEIYETRLNGKAWKPLQISSRWANLKAGFGRFSPKNIRSWPQLTWYFFSRSLKFLAETTWQIICWAESKTFGSARGQRSLWFLILGLVLIGQSLISLNLLLNGALTDLPLGDLLSSNAIRNITSNEFIFAKISIFLGLILVPSLGYAAANKNYRIYSNLLEQYRHRATVAQTLQGVLRYIEENDKNQDIRLSLTTIASAAMFELKNVGHLSKKDGDALPLGEILQGMLRK